MKDKPTLKAVIFNMDGVLIDSEPLHFEVDLMVLEQLNINENAHYLERFVGFTNPAMWKVIKTEYDIALSVEGLIQLQITKKLKHLADTNYQAISGVNKLLKELKKNKIPMGIASSSPRIFIEAVINKFNIFNHLTLL